jgi:hypothetical protein
LPDDHLEVFMKPALTRRGTHSQTVSRQVGQCIRARQA